MAACGAESAPATSAPAPGASGARRPPRCTRGDARARPRRPAPPPTQAPRRVRTNLSNWPANQPAPTDLAADQTYRSAVPEDPSSFDFNKDLYAAGSNYIWEGLLRYDPDFNLAPGTAESYEVGSGGSVYVFKLNPKATWSNGDPLTADDYIYSWTRQLDPATAASYAGFLLDIKGAESFNTKKGRRRRTWA